mgnify:FL=1
MNAIIEDFEQECTVQEQNRIVSINLNYRDITQIGFIKDKYRNVQELYLNHNLIQHLDGIQQFFNLQILSLKFNLIGRIEEFMKILNKRQLKSLNLIGNPTEKDERCNMTFFITCFPKYLHTSLNMSSHLNSSLLCFNDESKPRKQSCTPTKQSNSTEKTTLGKSTSRSSLLSVTNRSKSPVGKNTLRRDTSRSSVASVLKTEPVMPIMLKEQDLNIQRLMSEIYTFQKTATFAEYKGQASKKLDFVSKNFKQSPNLNKSKPRRHNEKSPGQERSTSRGMNKRKNSNIERTNSTLCHDAKPKHQRSQTITYGNAVEYLVSENSDVTQKPNIFEKHICNLERDIEELASIFHNKYLFERTFRALEKNTLEAKRKTRLARVISLLLRCCFLSGY